MEANPSSLALLHKSKERVLQVNPPRTHNSQFKPILLLFFFFFVLCINFIPNTSATVPISSSDFETLYGQHCNHIVPKSHSASDRFAPSGYGALPSRFRIGYFRGGSPLLNQIPVTGGTQRPQFIYFRPSNAGETIADGIYKLQATLNLRDSLTYSVLGSGNSTRRRLRLVRFRGPRFPMRRRSLSFSLDGFWSETSGKLCMIGSGSVIRSGMMNSLLVVLKLNYLLNHTIDASLITGSLESLEDNQSSNYFAPVSLMALAVDSSYEYTLLGKENEGGCFNGGDIGESLSVSKKDKCSILSGLLERFKLEYASDCNGFDCNPLGGGVGYMPDYMYYHRTRCTNGTKWQMLLAFPNSSYYNRFPFEPSTTLIAEGAWNKEENRFCAVACRILNFSESLANAYVGDCSIELSFRFPAILSLQNRSTVIGQIRNISSTVNSSSSSSSSFGIVGLRSFNEYIREMMDFKYEYTVTDTLGETCVKKNTARGKGKTYPMEDSADMRFDMSVRNSKGQVGWGYSIPFYVGDKLYRGNQFFMVPNNPPQLTQIEYSLVLNSSQSRPLNISYRLSFGLLHDFKFSHSSSSSNEVEISAEGTYDRDTGVVCMKGCRYLESSTQNFVTKYTLDCAIRVNVQFSPLNANSGKTIQGSIESTRSKSDPLYFGRLELSSNSIYEGQAAASIWRMDLEITMVLISNTLTCVLVGLQLYYIKSHPDVLPFICVVMLIVLTVGNMIPLLLNFEALFVTKRSQQSAFLGSGGWLEVNEVIVRIVTMVAFLLQLRLLQQTWSSRQGDGSEKSLWNSERKVLLVTLPLYIGGALLAWFVNHLKNSSSGISHRPFMNPGRKDFVVSPVQRHSLWEDLKSYAGLVLDGFLLPQIVFNLFSNSGEKALAPLFYTGTTMVRLLPHAYDLYRAHAYASYLDLSYIYASHRLDFYSTAWNIVIPCGGLLFAILIFLQQRFGGRSILPRFRHTSLYEKVPVISNEDL